VGMLLTMVNLPRMRSGLPLRPRQFSTLPGISHSHVPSMCPAMPGGETVVLFAAGLARIAAPIGGTAGGQVTGIG
jgi:hypothetical protein